MSQVIDPVVEAQRKAEEALQAARNAQDAKEVAFLDSVTHTKQIREGRTERDALRLKSRYVTTFGYDRWAKLVADSR